MKEMKLQQKERDLNKTKKDLQEKDEQYKQLREDTMQHVIEKIHHIIDNPVNVNALNKRKPKGSNMKLSSIAKRNPNFSLVAFTKIHRMQMNERLLQTLVRNDVERPKVMQEKF